MSFNRHKILHKLQLLSTKCLHDLGTRSKLTVKNGKIAIFSYRMFFRKKNVCPVLGIELGSPVLEANVLTTTLPILENIFLLKTKLDPF